MAKSTRFSQFHRRVRSLGATAALLVAAAAALHAHSSFSVSTSLSAAWDEENGGCDGQGLCGDSLDPYTDLVDGVDSWSNAYGNLIVSTMNSPVRLLCVDFPASPSHVYDVDMHSAFVGPNGNMLDGCYRGTLNTLANTEYGATDVGHEVASPQPISGGMTFFRNGVQYELRWARGGSYGQPYTAPPLKISFTSPPETWSLATYLADNLPPVSEPCPNCQYVEPQCPEGCVTLSVFSERKPRGRFVLANYVMPFQLTAETDANNRRRKGKK